MPLNYRFHMVKMGNFVMYILPSKEYIIARKKYSVDSAEAYRSKRSQRAWSRLALENWSGSQVKYPFTRPGGMPKEKKNITLYCLLNCVSPKT